MPQELPEASSTGSRRLEVVKKLIEKTREGKIPWKSQREGLVAEIEGSMRVIFTKDETPSIVKGAWNYFSVFVGGRSIMNVPNPSNVLLTLGRPPEDTNLQKVAEQLYRTASDVMVADDVNRAIKFLDEI